MLLQKSEGPGVICIEIETIRKSRLEALTIRSHSWMPWNILIYVFHFSISGHSVWLYAGLANGPLLHHSPIPQYKFHCTRIDFVWCLLSLVDYRRNLNVDQHRNVRCAVAESAMMWMTVLNLSEIMHFSLDYHKWASSSISWIRKSDPDISSAGPSEPDI